MNNTTCVKTVTELEPLSLAETDLRLEQPLFAADWWFAQEHAGPVARAFLMTVPEAWQQQHLVIDSALVWLRPDIRMGDLRWHHEPFPGRDDGVCAQSNQQRDAEHLACCWGAAGIDFLSGEDAIAAAAEPLADGAGFKERHQRLQEALDAGRINCQSIASGTPYRYGWGAFYRHQAAQTSGFMFWMRVTRGDNRPLVNGIRNSTNL